MTGLVTAMVALFGIGLTTVSLIMTGRQNKAHRAAMKEDREAAQVEKRAAIDAARSEHFTRAIAHLKDDSVAIRLGALYDLKKLYEDSEEDSKKLASILTAFLREHIENEKFILPPYLGRHRRRVDQDVYLVADILSTLFDKYGLQYNLSHLQANGISLWGINLRGANLIQADLEDTGFREANLQKADLWDAYLGKANLQDIDLRGAKHITALQLLVANVDDTTLLDSDLRIAYDRLKAEQKPTTPEA